MDNNFKKGFFKEANKKKEPRISAGEGALAAGGATAAAVAGRDMLANTVRDTFEKRKIKASRGTGDFLKKLKPGDVILTGAQKGSALDSPIVLKDYFEKFQGNKNKLLNALGKKKLPVNEHDLLKLVSGSPFYHMAIYTGKGNVVNADGNVVRGEKLKNMIEGGSAKAYRFKDTDKKKAKKAVTRASKLKGREYMTIPEQIERGARMMADPTKGGVCRKLPNGRVVCTDVVQTAYREKFPRRIIDHRDVQSAKGSELIARYSRNNPTLRHKILSNLGAPVAKSMRYALPAALAGGIAAKVYDIVKKRNEKKA